MNDGSETTRSATERGEGPSRRNLLDEHEIRKRIKIGNAQRKHMKKGITRRLLGNVRNMIAGFAVASCVFGVMMTEAMKRYISSRPDIMEVFAGHAEVSHRFACWGWCVSEPYDIIYNGDLRDEGNRKKLLDTIRELRPRLVTIAYPCTVWSPINNLGCQTSQEKRRLRKRQRADLPFLELTEQIFETQLGHGGDALGENPVGSQSFQQPPVQRIINHPEVTSRIGHGCRHNIRHVRSGRLLQKPTVWFSTSPEIVDELGLKCKGDHEHDVCLGGRDITQKAGQYTPEIARAIHKGFVKVMKRKDPGRIRVMLREVLKSIQREVIVISKNFDGMKNNFKNN